MYKTVFAPDFFNTVSGAIALLDDALIAVPFEYDVHHGVEYKYKDQVVARMSWIRPTVLNTTVIYEVAEFFTM